MHAALFLDRDGTLIEDRGHLRHPDEVAFYPDAVAALKSVRDDFLFFIVTQQSGIAQGLLTPEEAAAVNRHVVDTLARAGIVIQDVYCCPHARGGGCDCIKPNPTFLLQAARDYDLDLARSFTLGDHPHDVHLGTNAGGRGIYLLTGHGSHHVDELSPDIPVAAGIAEAVQLIRRLHSDDAEASAGGGA